MKNANSKKIPGKTNRRFFSQLLHLIVFPIFFITYTEAQVSSHGISPAAIAIKDAAPSFKTIQNGGTIVFEGIAEGDTKGYNRIYYHSPTGEADSVTVNHGRFLITAPFTSPGEWSFYTEYEAKTKGMIAPAGFLIDSPGITRMNINIQDGFRMAKITGSKTTEAFDLYHKQYFSAISLYFKEIERLKASTKEHASKGSMLYIDNRIADSLWKLIVTLVIKNFVGEHSNDFVGAYVLNQSKSFLNEKLSSIFNLLSPGMKASELGQEIAEYEKAKRQFAKIGNKKLGLNDMISNFSLPDQNNQPFRFNQLEGKYVWIDFWASWCHSCRQSFPEMKRMYEKYRGKKFEILGISVDEGKTAWLKALKEDKNPWIQVLDRVKNIADLFAVHAYPTAFLVDPSGKIIFTEVGFEANGEKTKIEQKLDELLLQNHQASQTIMQK